MATCEFSLLFFSPFCIPTWINYQRFSPEEAALQAAGWLLFGGGPASGQRNATTTVTKAQKYAAYGVEGGKGRQVDFFHLFFVSVLSLACCLDAEILICFPGENGRRGDERSGLV